MSVELVTSQGSIFLELFYRQCPRTCRNFLELAKSGFYDGIIWHRIVAGFMAQTGDPLGNGSGGESIYGHSFEDEIVAKLSHNQAGMLSMANAGLNTNSSQFFISFGPCQHLDGKHTVFGRVSDGMQVLNEMEHVKVDKSNRPKMNVKLFSVHVIEDPWAGQPLPEGCSIPEKPLVSSSQLSRKKSLKDRKDQCVVQ